MMTKEEAAELVLRGAPEGTRPGYIAARYFEEQLKSGERPIEKLTHIEEWRKYIEALRFLGLPPPNEEGVSLEHRGGRVVLGSDGGDCALLRTEA